MPLNIAMIGAGRMGQTHAEVLQTISDVNIVAVVDFIPANAKKLANIFSAKVMSYPEVLADDSIQAVIITTPTASHADLIIAAAEAGKAIFTEKPATHDLPSAKRVLEVLKETKAQCQVGFMRRYDPAYIEVKKRIDNNQLGKLENFRAISRDPKAPSIDFLRSSGGIMVDFGIHDFDSARFFMGEISELHCIAMRDKSLEAEGLYDLAVAVIKFESGAIGTLELALNTSYGYEIVADILGELGKYHLEKKQELAFEVWNADGISHDYPPDFAHRFPEAYANEIIAFANNVLANKELSPTVEDATKSLVVALAAQKSLETGKSIKISKLMPSFL